MPLHLLKLCVGCDSVKDLEDWIKVRLKEKKKKGEKPERFHRTRMVPKRTDELTDGGSLYWVIRGEVMCRERILGIVPFTDKDGVGRCRVPAALTAPSAATPFSRSLRSMFSLPIFVIIEAFPLRL